MSFLSRLFKRHAPQEQLVIDVAKELRRRGVEGAGYDPQDYSMVVSDKKVGLHNLFLEWRLRGRRDKAMLVKRFLDGQLEAPMTLTNFDAAADKLVPLVRSRHDICLWLLENQCAGAPLGNSTETAWAPLVGDLVTAVGLDHGNGIGRMTWANLQHFGVTLDVALQRGMVNFQRKAPASKFIEVGHGMPPGIYHSDSASDFQSSMLLLPERLPRLPDGAGDLIAMVPGRNSMWITGSRNEAGISGLLDVAEKSLDAVHHRCSMTMLRLDGGKWNVFSPEGNEALKKRHNSPLKKQEAMNYGYQKSVLDRFYPARNDNVYVGLFNFAANDEASKSWTAWPSHADSLLPHADFIVFVEQIVDANGLAVGSKSFIEVTWDRALPLVANLMKEVPDLYPPRYRVRRFPDGPTLAALAQLGQRREGKIQA